MHFVASPLSSPTGIARYCPRHTVPWEYSRSREVVFDALVSVPDVPVRDGTLDPGVSGQCVVRSKCSFFVLSDYPKIC